MSAQDRVVGWQLDRAGAESYEAHLVPAFMAPWAADLVAAVGVAPGDAVLDVACGTGIVARYAAAATGDAGEVTGVDVNSAMLAVARDVSSGLGVRWERATADDLPLADASFDVVCCQQGLQFFAEPAAALREMWRVTRPGGRIGIGVCGALEHQPGYHVLVDRLREHVGAPAADVIRSPYALGDVTRLRALLDGGGFVDLHLRRLYTTFRVASGRALLQAETSASPLGDVLETLDPDRAEALVDDLEAAMAPWSDDDGVVFPFETLVVTARRDGAG